jgi:modification target Cys-rich repeat protein
MTLTIAALQELPAETGDAGDLDELSDLGLLPCAWTCFITCFHTCSVTDF